MSDCFLKATIDNWPEVIELGILLGLLYEEKDINGEPTGRHYSIPDGYVFIGPIYEPTGQMINDPELGLIPETAPITNPQGDVYWHANLRTEINIRQRAEFLQGGHPELAQALGRLNRYFVTTGNNPRKPNNQRFKYAGDP